MQLLAGDSPRRRPLPPGAARAAGRLHLSRPRVDVRDSVRRGVLGPELADARGFSRQSECIGFPIWVCFFLSHATCVSYHTHHVMDMLQTVSLLLVVV